MKVENNLSDKVFTLENEAVKMLLDEVIFVARELGVCIAKDAECIAKEADCIA